MRIISHRGFWKLPEEKNQIVAFERSFQAGFGTETDLRDCAGRIVISHDPPVGNEIDFDSFCEIYNRFKERQLPIALNIKADGLSHALSNALTKHKITNYFVFDMSIPDMRSYLKREMDTFTRVSDLEPIPLMLDRSTGVWVDGFERDWDSLAELDMFLLQHKKVCIVSPELHGRPHLSFWNSLRRLKHLREGSLLLCTDFPDESMDFFSNDINPV